MPPWRILNLCTSHEGKKQQKQLGISDYSSKYMLVSTRSLQNLVSILTCKCRGTVTLNWGNTPRGRRVFLCSCSCGTVTVWSWSFNFANSGSFCSYLQWHTHACKHTYTYTYTHTHTHTHTSWFSQKL